MSGVYRKFQGLTGPRCGRRGYTLIELLFVMVIILILVGMVASGLASMTRSRRVKNSTASVLNVIHMARSRAISDNAITHVRVENSGRNDQRISVYRFIKAADAVRATTETQVASLGPDLEHMGWNPLSDPDNGYTNYRMEGQKLEPNCWFETEYDQSKLWNSYQNHPANLPILYTHVPKSTTDPLDPLIFFYPDGTASGNLLLYVRDDTHLMWVRVYRGGEVKSGDITGMADFNYVN